MEAKENVMSEYHFTQHNIPHPFEVSFLMPTKAKIEFHIMHIDDIAFFKEWLRAHPEVIFWESFCDPFNPLLARVRYATINVDKEKIPKHEKEQLQAKLFNIIWGMEAAPPAHSTYLLMPDIDLSLSSRILGY